MLPCGPEDKVVAKSVRLGETAARDLGIIHEEAERRLGFRMSDTQAAAFGLAELCRLWDRATIPTGAAFDRSMSRRTAPDEPQPVNHEHPFGGLEARMSGRQMTTDDDTQRGAK